MQLLDGKPAAALQAYQLSLSSDPNRFNGLLDAARAAELAGQPTALAAGYYRAPLAHCKDANGAARERLEHARAVVRSRAAVREDLGPRQDQFVPGSSSYCNKW